MADLLVGAERHRVLVDLQRGELVLEHLHAARCRPRTSRSRRPGRPRASRRSASPSWRRPGTSASSSSAPRSRPERRRTCEEVRPPPVRNGSPKWRAICPVHSRPMPDSGVPNVGEPDCMSMLDRNDPKITGRAGPDQLGERDPGQRLDDLLHQRGRDGHRRHRAHQDERRQDDGLAGRGVLELRLEHPVVPLQRRVAVDQRDRDRGLLDRLAAAEQDRRPSRSCRGRSRPETTLPM